MLSPKKIATTFAACCVSLIAILTCLTIINIKAISNPESLGVKRVVEVHSRPAYKGGVKFSVLLSNAKDYDVPDKDVIDSGVRVGDRYEVYRVSSVLGTREYIERR